MKHMAVCLLFLVTEGCSFSTDTDKEIDSTDDPIPIESTFWDPDHPFSHEAFAETEKKK